MTASLLALLLAASTPDAFVRAKVTPAQQCVSGPSVLVTLHNNYSRSLLVSLSVEAWSGGQKDPWLLVHEDMFRPESIAPSKVVIAMSLPPGEDRTFPWDLSKRTGPPDLRPGLYRVVASISAPSVDWKVGTFEIARFELRECPK